MGSVEFDIVDIDSFQISRLDLDTEIVSADVLVLREVVLFIQDPEIPKWG